MEGLIAFFISFFVAVSGYTLYKIKTYDGLTVVSKREVKKILIKYNLTDDFNNGKIVCPVTKTVITYTNVGIIRKAESFDKPVFISNSLPVMRKSSEYSDDLLYRLSYT